VLDNTDQYFANFQSVPQTSQTLAENLVHPKTDSSSHAETIQAAILQASNIRCKADRIHACISSPPPTQPGTREASGGTLALAKLQTRQSL
jgi:hypothetical protein